MRLCFLLISENTLTTSHQYDYPDMFGTRMTPINCHVGLGKVHRNSTLRKLLQAIKESCEQERWSSAGKSTLTGGQAPNGHDNMQTSNFIYMKLCIFRNICLARLGGKTSREKCNSIVTSKRKTKLKPQKRDNARLRFIDRACS